MRALDGVPAKRLASLRMAIRGAAWRSCDPSRTIGDTIPGQRVSGAAGLSSFDRLIERLPRPLRILDVGGTSVFWRTMGLAGARDTQITLVNIEPPEPSSEPNITGLQGDARDLSAFGDRTFDVVFSNSLIEHVGGPEDQRRVAQEVQRVGRAFFVQTPNRNFPLEPHFLFPFFQYLPVSSRVYLVTHFSLGWIDRMDNREEARRLVESVQLVDERRFRELFPSARIWHERVFGLVKSFVAYGGFSVPGPGGTFKRSDTARNSTAPVPEHR